MSDQLTIETPARRWPLGLRPLLLRSAAAALLFAMALPGLSPAFADEVDDLRREVERLKQQVLFLQNQIPGASAGTAGGGTAAAQAEVRAQQFQQQLTDLTGQIERVQLKVDDVATQLERMQKDTEYRLGVREGTGGAMPPVDGAAAGGGAVSDGAGPSLSGAPQQVGAGAQTTQPATPAPAPSGQPGVLGTLTTQQAANLPQAPAGAAEAAAAQAAAQAAMPSSAVVLPGHTPRGQ